MNIILLSGGSGQRLWPLSNEVRSKQFVRLFKAETGEYESMVQRVFRQIHAVDDESKITIATSRYQVSTIRNQLGNKVSICVEPCRRDTFPAIALASVYLHDILKVSLDECIVICPIDPFVEDTYFHTIRYLEPLVCQQTAKITLMGIVPTYPSDKYGYIIPQNSDMVSMVKEFKEKPNTEIAKRYLEQGALWNSGIFAFKLGYLLDKAHAMIDFTDYYDLYAKYDTLPQISFDYAVVEKEPSIQVMRYVGGWKDIGTWNMMAEVMSEFSKGNVTMDSFCVNTHVVNELDIPVLCMGCKDMVVAVSSDGVLVTDKERSGYMKPFVEKISAPARFAEKSWGTYTVIDVQPGATTVKITLQSGSRLKYHSHEHRDEVWTVLSGYGSVLVDGEKKDIMPGDTISALARCKHTVIAASDMTLLEVQIGSDITSTDKMVYPLSEEDIF